jgi:L-histidine N-alpha-methyltransferase
VWHPDRRIGGFVSSVVTASSLPHDEAEELRNLLLEDPPSIPSRYFYDDEGSALFEEITELDEYYPTRTELGILEQYAPEIVARAGVERVAELGAGAGRKISWILDSMGGSCRSVELLDVNERFVRDSASRLSQRYPGVSVVPRVGRFDDPACLGPGGRRMILFFGSTIGNFLPEDTVAFLARLRGCMDATDSVLIGFDLVKDPDVLHRAYNDARGVTAAFNQGILRGFGRAVGADLRPESWEHVAFYDAERRWIEMRLRTAFGIDIQLPALGLRFRLPAGGEVRTEISCKYTEPGVRNMADRAGLRVDGWWTDPQNWFALGLLRCG